MWFNTTSIRTNPAATRRQHGRLYRRVTTEPQTYTAETQINTDQQGTESTLQRHGQTRNQHGPNTICTRPIVTCITEGCVLIIQPFCNQILKV
ncbi:hypothetical protein DPMN_168895 [Dreissena polymorpha]|uniref:Uncharacterized protein n=1 Tax=Dreissena polymorpha TaxID=45954 RepID=A0A9D4F2T0_DREPO|nr:hypothetical protein DPMN_168895 [Dreissena polymorpha]